MRLQLGVSGSQDLWKWPVARFLRASHRLAPGESNRWRSRFLKRQRADGRARWILAARIAIHLLLVERPMLFVFGLIAAIFILGVGLGGLFA
jgi:hypothetical protein